MLIRQLRQVNLVVEEQGEHKIVPAALADKDHAMYRADGRLYLVKVAKTSMELVYTSDSSCVMLGCSDDETNVVELLLHKLHHMTAYHFLTKVILALKEEQKINLFDMKE